MLFHYHEDIKAISAGVDEGMRPAFNNCIFEPGDFNIISDFFRRAELHKAGKDIDLSDIELN